MVRGEKEVNVEAWDNTVDIRVGDIYSVSEKVHRDDGFSGTVVGTVIQITPYVAVLQKSDGICFCVYLTDFRNRNITGIQLLSKATSENTKEMERRIRNKFK